MLGQGLVRAMGVTMRNFVRAPFTVQYPDMKVGLWGASRHAGLSPLRFLAGNPKEGVKALMFMATVPVRLGQATSSCGTRTGAPGAPVARSSARWESSRSSRTPAA